MGSITLRQAVRRILEEDELRKAAGILFDLAALDGDEETEEREEQKKTVPTTIKEARSAIIAGKYKIGDIVLEKRGVKWRLVNRMGNNYTIMSTTAFAYAPFARPSKKHPYGWNDWVGSQIRKELNTTWLDKLFPGEEDSIVFVYDRMAKLFLLSEEEVGFKQTENTLDYFRKTEEIDEKELRRRRSILDYDGDECVWWLRSPYPGAYVVRLVLTDGSLSIRHACLGHGAVAACVI